jgi:hypothetical protein
MNPMAGDGRQPQCLRRREPARILKQIDIKKVSVVDSQMNPRGEDPLHQKRALFALSPG